LRSVTSDGLEYNSSSPPREQFIIGPAVINTHTT
jgi:hypothetical protein